MARIAEPIHRPKTLTDAQQRALEWLPADGSWRMDAGRLTAALNSLSLAGLCTGEWGDFGPRGGRALRWRRKAKGVE